MHLSDLQNKDIVNIKDGEKIGKIIDVLIDNNGSIKALIIHKYKFFSIIPNNSELEVRWNQIKTIGQDVILIEL